MNIISLLICAATIAFANTESDSTAMMSKNDVHTKSSFELLVNELDSTSSPQTVLDTPPQTCESLENDESIASAFVCDKQTGNLRLLNEVEKKAGLCDDEKLGHEAYGQTCTRSGWKDTKIANTENIVFEKGQIVSGTINPNYKFFQDTRDGHIYFTAKIGGLVWMAEDLNFEDNLNSDSLQTNSWCHKNDPDSCAKYGRFYTWAKAMDSLGIYSENGKNCGYGNLCQPTYPVRGICPEGWHLPDITESEVLMNVKNSSSADTLSQETSSNRIKIPDSTNSDKKYFLFEGPYVYFWNSTERDEYYAYYPAIHFYGMYASGRYFNKASGLPVRCVMTVSESSKASTNQQPSP